MRASYRAISTANYLFFHFHSLGSSRLDTPLLLLLSPPLAPHHSDFFVPWAQHRTFNVKVNNLRTNDDVAIVDPSVKQSLYVKIRNILALSQAWRERNCPPMATYSHSPTQCLLATLWISSTPLFVRDASRQNRFHRGMHVNHRLQFAEGHTPLLAA